MNRVKSKNKIFILDGTMIKEKIEFFSNDLFKHVLYTDMDFRTEHLVIKDIISTMIVKLISETNSIPVSSVIPSYMSSEALYNRNTGSHMNDLHMLAYGLYKNMFRFEGNIEVLIDVNLSGNNITVFTYENELG